MTARTTRLAIALRIFCAALLLSLGFAHQPLHAQPFADPASSYYLLPDGTFAGLCIDNADHGKPRKSWQGSGCDACRLAASVLLPTPSAGSALVPRGYLAIGPPARTALLNRTIPRQGSPVRGPPFVFA